MTTGTNLQLTYDENTDSWSYQNVDYEYPSGSTNSWSGYTTADPAFEFAPEEPTTTTPSPDEDPCPPGYTYDTTLLQCVPDPNYQAPMYAGEPGIEGERDYARDAQESFIEFDASTPSGREAMYEHGLSHGYFTTDTSKGGAYKFKGPKKTGMTLFGLQGLAQFGEDRQYDRYINELAREDAKRRAAGQSPILAQAVGFFGLAESFRNWGSYAMDVAANIHDTTTGFQEPTKTAATIPADTDILAPKDRLAEERKQEIHEEKLKQEQIETEKKLREDLGRDTSSQVPTYVDTVQDRQEQKDKQRQVETEKKLREDLGRDISSQVPTYVDTAQDRQEQRDKRRETKKESSSQITRQTRPTGHQR